MIVGSGAKIWGSGPIVGAFGSRFVGLRPRFGTQGQHLGLSPTACGARIRGSGAKIKSPGDQYWGL